ncbi:hypothetical protein M5K25_022054 [Dendrobium thyrsiflorum]|uniref:Uncharacterized protein n=1 Tax=Dendrobium thyrsiflorum TaxID=117978 RepID=A0ABD0U5G7_DENTH
MQNQISGKSKPQVTGNSLCSWLIPDLLNPSVRRITGFGRRSERRGRKLPSVRTSSRGSFRQKCRNFRSTGREVVDEAKSTATKESKGEARRAHGIWRGGAGEARRREKVTSQPASSRLLPFKGVVTSDPARRESRRRKQVEQQRRRRRRKGAATFHGQASSRFASVKMSQPPILHSTASSRRRSDQNVGTSDLNRKERRRRSEVEQRPRSERGARKGERTRDVRMSLPRSLFFLLSRTSCERGGCDVYDVRRGWERRA